MGKAELKIAIDATLLAEAGAADVLLDAAFEAGARQALDWGKSRLDLVDRGRKQAADPMGAEARAKAWAEESAEAIAEHSERIERRGLIGDEWRK